MQTMQDLLQHIEGVGLSERGKRRREAYLKADPRVSASRMKLAMESWKETEGEHLEQRRAKLLKKVLDGIPIAIHPDQLLVGASTEYVRGANPHSDYDGTYLKHLMDEGSITLGGPEVKGKLSSEEWESLREAVTFFQGKTATDLVAEKIQEVMGSWYEDALKAGFSQRYEGIPCFPQVLDWERVVTRGLRDLIADAEDRIKQFIDRREDDVEKLFFWQAAIVCCKAVIDHARRYARTALEMAEKEQDPERKKELAAIAETCTWVPENPARTFREALQSIILIYVGTHLESPCVPPTGYGMIDQYLYPYFKKDLEDGRLTVESAVDLVGDFLTFNIGIEHVQPVDWREHVQKSMLTSLRLGGVTLDGQDRTNELTHLILHTVGLYAYAEPHVVIAWHRGTPRQLMLKALQTNYRVKGGVPQFQNSEHIAKFFTDRGVSPEAAVNWRSGGCSQAAPADQGAYLNPTYMNAALCVDLALHNGVASKTGKRIGLETGDARKFQSFAELYEAFKKQFDYMSRKAFWHDRLVDRLKWERYRQPLASALVQGCLERGKEFSMGGQPHYIAWHVKDRGLIPAADSLTAVRKLVFDEKRLSMNELLDALDSDFAGERGEEIRQMCLGAPKYGNDLDEPDQMVHDVAKYTASVVASEKNIFGWPRTLNRNGQSWHFQNGKKLGALPNGRKSGEILPDGSLSPMQGQDVCGPTAVLNSALKADFKESLAAVFTQTFPGMLMQSEESREKLAMLTQTFLSEGGTYIQYNIMDRATLLDAKLHPEQHRDLIVRVGGYSAYFVELSPEIQDELISRTEQII